MRTLCIIRYHTGSRENFSVPFYCEPIQARPLFRDFLLSHGLEPSRASIIDIEQLSPADPMPRRLIRYLPADQRERYRKDRAAALARERRRRKAAGIPSPRITRQTAMQSVY